MNDDVGALVKSLERHIRKKYHTREYLVNFTKIVYGHPLLNDTQKNYLGGKIEERVKPDYSLQRQ